MRFYQRAKPKKVIAEDEIVPILDPAENNNNHNTNNATTTKMAEVPLGGGVGVGRGTDENNNNKDATVNENSSSSSSAPPPVGYWKDGIWNICGAGICHASVWFSCLCTLLSIGQLITRLKLNMFGNPPSRNNYTYDDLAFKKYLYIVVSYWVLRAYIFMVIMALDPNKSDVVHEYINPSGYYFFFAALDDLFFYGTCLYIALVLRNIRRYVRNKYSIPAKVYCEDCASSLFCSCFTAAQMMRHTADYKKHYGYCCSSTGLPRNV